MKYHKIAKPIAFALAAMLAIPPVSASAITFADINQAPWPGAEVSINKAAELKLVVGETINGKNYFKPKDPVSLTQTCQLAYKLLLETGKAKAVRFSTLEAICRELNCQPGDILEYEED